MKAHLYISSGQKVQPNGCFLLIGSAIAEWQREQFANLWRPQGILAGIQLSEDANDIFSLHHHFRITFASKSIDPTKYIPAQTEDEDNSLKSIVSIRKKEHSSEFYCSDCWWQLSWSKH